MRIPCRFLKSFAGCCLSLLLAPCSLDAAAFPQQLLPTSILGPAALGLVVNRADPYSLEVGAYYQAKRLLPEANVVYVDFKPGNAVMNRATFERVKSRVDSSLPEGVQALALAWTVPYRVGCMSLTTAFTAGYDDAFCAKGCEATRASPYFDADVRAPYSELGWRPSMLLAGASVAAARALIDRGVRADHSYPAGTGYLVETGDRYRNVRAAYYPAALAALGSRVGLVRVAADGLRDREDILFYFTGIARVPDLDTNRFRPGALADHLTSAGGRLLGSRQMSILEWLSAGATGSYGAVVEPCNFPRKFPHPGVLMRRYLNGETLLEAYWKSVAWPGQGVFVGEPLARPYGAFWWLDR